MHIGSKEYLHEPVWALVHLYIRRQFIRLTIILDFHLPKVSCYRYRIVDLLDMLGRSLVLSTIMHQLEHFKKRTGEKDTKR